MMQRIVIVGSGGSGKSLLAQQVGEALDLDVVHLDRLLWKPGRVRISAAEQEAIVREVVSPANWGGGYDHLFGFSALDCLWRTITRFFQHRGQSCVGATAGCSERLKPNTAAVVTLRSRKEIGRFLGALPSQED